MDLAEGVVQGRVERAGDHQGAEPRHRLGQRDAAGRGENLALQRHGHVDRMDNIAA